MICGAESEASTQENAEKIFTTNDLLEEKQLEVLEWEDGPEFIDTVIIFAYSPLKYRKSPRNTTAMYFNIIKRFIEVILIF